MAERDKIVAVGLLTGAEFARWGSKLRHVYEVGGNDDFAELLEAIDRADLDRQKQQAEDT